MFKSKHDKYRVTNKLYNKSNTDKYSCIKLRSILSETTKVPFEVRTLALATVILYSANKGIFFTVTSPIARQTNSYPVLALK